MKTTTYRLGTVNLYRYAILIVKVIEKICNDYWFYCILFDAPLKWKKSVPKIVGRNFDAALLEHLEQENRTQYELFLYPMEWDPNHHCSKRILDLFFFFFKPIKFAIWLLYLECLKSSHSKIIGLMKKISVTAPKISTESQKLKL